MCNLTLLSLSCSFYFLITAIFHLQVNYPHTLVSIHMVDLLDFTEMEFERPVVSERYCKCFLPASQSWITRATRVGLTNRLSRLKPRALEKQGVSSRTIDLTRLRQDLFILVIDHTDLFSFWRSTMATFIYLKMNPITDL